MTTEDESWKGAKDSYYYFLIPSCLSFVMSLFMLFSVMKNKNFRNKLFHQLSALLAFSDLIQCSAWFFGCQSDQSNWLCYTQAYLFQAGTLYKAAIICLITGVVFYTFQTGVIINLNNNVVKAYFVFTNVLLLISLSLNVAELFCPFEIAFDRNKTTILFVCYLLPVIIFTVVTTGCYIWIFLYSKMVTSLNITRAANNLNIYPIIYLLSCVPLGVFIILDYWIDRDNKNINLFCSWAVLISLSGFTIGMHYFYTNREGNGDRSNLKQCLSSPLLTPSGVFSEGASDIRSGCFNTLSHESGMSAMEERFTGDSNTDGFGRSPIQFTSMNTRGSYV